MKCKVCGFEETLTDDFVGIFTRGSCLETTNGDNCALYGCPNCHSIIYVTDEEYIKQKKKEWKERGRR